MENGCNKFFLIGIRGWEYEETVLFTEKDFIKVYKASDCKKIASSNLADEIVKKISKDDAVYISFDIDAIDPGFAPGTGTPEAFGLNPDYVLDLLNIFFNKLNVLAIDFVEISPKLDVNNITSWLCLKYLYEILYNLKGDK